MLLHISKTKMNHHTPYVNSISNDKNTTYITGEYKRVRVSNTYYPN